MKKETKDKIAPWISSLRLLVVWGFPVALLASFRLAFMGAGTRICADGVLRGIKLAEAIVLISWIILPPIWFWIEFFFSNWEDDKDFGEEGKRFDRLKYGQDISSKIWIAVSGVLLMLYFGKDIK